MDAPPAQEDVGPFRGGRICFRLASAHPILPKTRRRPAAARGFRRRHLYAAARPRRRRGRTLCARHRHADRTASCGPGARGPGLPPYDEERLLRRRLLVDWYAAAVAGRQICARNIWPVATVLPRPQCPQTLALRDFHVDNLMLLRPPGVRVRAPRLPGRRVGPVDYDLVSLLEDARRDVPTALRDAMFERYLAAFPALDRTAFGAPPRSWALSATARSSASSRGFGCATASRITCAHPAGLAPVEQALGHPALAPMAHWLDRHLPHAVRCGPLWSGA